jgi:hypothetical protein
VSYLVGTRGCPQGIKLYMRETLFNAGLKSGGAVPPLPHAISWHEG